MRRRTLTTLDLQPLQAEPPARPDEAGPLIHRGADLVHLCEQLHIRLLALALVLLGAAGVIAVPLAQTNPLEGVRPLTIVFCVLAILAAACGLIRRRETYLWLRHNRTRQLTPGLIAAAIVLADGPYSPSWWIALALALTVTTVSTTGPTLIAGTLTASAYAAGTLLRGASLLPGGDTEYLTVIGGLIVNPLIARAVIESFARFVLRLHRLEQEAATAAAQPIPLGSVVSTHAVELPAKEQEQRAEEHTQHERPSTPHRRDASRLTARQTEVVLLARDGLRQAEIAECLGITTRQVEHQLAQARHRAKATTTAQLVAMLVSLRLVPAPSGHTNNART
jgi:DNA-binding CsgD family transcriptional regulator